MTWSNWTVRFIFQLPCIREAGLSLRLFFDPAQFLRAFSSTFSLYIQFLFHKIQCFKNPYAPLLTCKQISSSTKILIFTLNLFSMANLYAGEVVPIDYRKLRTAQKVTFILIPPTFERKLVHWDETIFKRIGCTSVTQDPARVGSLIQILQRAGFKEQPASGIKFRLPPGADILPAASGGIYLTFSDGSEARFLFEPENPPNEINSQFTQLPSNYLLYANGSLPWYLTYWASQNGELTSKDSATQAECRMYIRRYIYLQL